MDGFRGGGTGKGGDKLLGGGAGGGMNKGLAGILKGLGIATLVGIVAKLVATSQSLVSVVSAILKLIGFLLKPIADVVMVLLMPILFMLKPIVQAVNHIMAPFLKQSMKLLQASVQSRAAGDSLTAGMQQGAAINTIFAGLSGVMVYLVAEVIRMISTMFIDAITASLIIIFPSAKDRLLANSMELKDMISQNLDSVVAGTMFSLSKSVASMSEQVGVSSAQFKIDSANMIQDVFSNSKAGLSATFVSELDSFRTEGQTAIRAAVDAFKAEMARLSRAATANIFGPQMPRVGITPSGAGYSLGRPLNDFERALGYTDSNGSTGDSSSANTNLDNRYVPGSPSKGGGGLTW